MGVLDGGSKGKRKSGGVLGRGGGVLAGLAEGTSTAGGSGDGFLAGVARSPLGAALRALDLPHDAVIAVLKELDDLVPGTGADRAKSDGFSLGDIRKNFAAARRDELGAGHLVDTGNRWVDRAVGFAGDVAADPLSYVTLGATKVGDAASTATKTEAARVIAQEAGARGDQTLLEIAEKVAREGTGSLTKAEAERVGLKLGATIGIGSHRVSIPGTEGLARGVNAATAPARGAVRSDAAYRLLQSLDPQNRFSRTGLPRAELFTAEGPLKRLLLLDARRLARQEARGMANAAKQQLSDLAERFKDVDPEDLRRGLQGEAPITPEGAQAVAELRQLLDGVRQSASDLAGTELGYIDNYLPVSFSNQLRALIDEKRAARAERFASKTARSAKERRVFNPERPGTFMGVQLEGSTPQALLDQAERILKERLGEGALEAFEKNPWKLIDRYVSGMERFAAQEGVGRNLGVHGAAVADVAAEPQALNQERLFKLDDDFPADPERVPAKQLEELTLRAEADELYEAADTHTLSGEHDLAAVAALEAVARHEAADLVGKEVLPLDEWRKQLAELPVTDAAVNAIRMMPGDGSWVADTLAALANQNAFTDRGWFLKAFDKATSAFKAMAVLSPGFHFRNLQGAVFNNSLAGVDPSIYGRFVRASKGLASDGIDGVSDDLRPFFAELETLGYRGGEVGRDLADVAEHEVPKLTGNRLFQWNRRQGQRVEYFARGALYVDRRLKGQTVEQALDAIDRFHFNYNELSPTAQAVGKRLVPFYTWTRRNFPLQLEMMVRRPGRYTRWLHAQGNLEMGQEDDPEAPSWVRSLVAIKSPWLAPGGQQMFLTPDLPFQDLSETLNVEQAAASLNPLVRLPLEGQRGRRYFDNARLDVDQDVPAPWRPLILALKPLNPLIRKAGLGGINDDGTISGKLGNALDSAVPVLGRVKRLLPSDERSQARAFSSWLSFLTGVSTRTMLENDHAIQEASRALGRRSHEVDTAVRPTAKREQGGSVREAYLLAKQQLGLD